MQSRLPVDLGSLPVHFATTKTDTVLSIDGDGPAYVVASKFKTVATAVRHYQQKMLELIFLARATECRVHLTADHSLKGGRFSIKAHKPYQGNRKGKSKPPLLEAVRAAVARPENVLDDYLVILNTEVEADDGMIQDAYQFKERHITWSDDKDLRMTPYQYLCQHTLDVLPCAGFGSIWMRHTPAGAARLEGHGLKFFWAQMLMGDTADNIQGIIRLDGRLCGPVGAFEYLHPIQSEAEVANAVLDSYRAIDQNPIPEGWLLWLTRWRGDTFWQYLTELDLSPVNQAYIQECVQRDWWEKPADG